MSAGNPGSDDQAALLGRDSPEITTGRLPLRVKPDPWGKVNWMAVKKIAHPTIDERKAVGSQARDQTPPSSHAGWKPAAGRPDPVGLLE